MSRKLLGVAIVAAVVVAVPMIQLAGAHCQVPCGIYDDAARFAALREHVTTIEKSMAEIAKLGAADKPNYNQIVRWVNNKDHHADELSEIVTYYFLAQRIKPVDGSDKAAQAKYVLHLTLLHKMMVASMKCKQTTDVAHCKTLRALIDEFEKSYLPKK